MKKILILLTLSCNIFANELPYIEDSRYMDFRDDYKFKLDLGLMYNKSAYDLYKANKDKKIQEFVLSNIGQKYKISSKDSLNLFIKNNFFQVGVAVDANAHIDSPVFPVITADAYHSINYTYGYKFNYNKTIIFPKVHYIKEKQIHEHKTAGELLDYKFKLPKYYEKYYDAGIRLEQNVSEVIFFYDQLSFKNNINNYGLYFNQKDRFYLNKNNIGIDLNISILTLIMQRKNQGLAIDFKLFKIQFLKSDDKYQFNLTI